MHQIKVVFKIFAGPSARTLKKFGLVIPFLSVATTVLAHNSYRIDGPTPPWFTGKESQRMDKIVDAMEKDMEWQVRRISVRFTDAKEFEPYGKNLRALTRGEDQAVLLGPLINKINLSDAFAHELTHVIVLQKYREAIPAWLSEGLANFIGAKTAKKFGGSYQPVAYSELAAWMEGLPAFQLNLLSHPLRRNGQAAPSASEVRMRYHASTALMEMLAKKCDIFDLIHLAVGKRLETYLKNACEIDENSLVENFKNFVNRKGMKMNLKPQT